MSLPPRGAWIEIQFRVHQNYFAVSRSPRGERGLKFRPTIMTTNLMTSLPPRGAWIEISCAYSMYSHQPCRSPRGERGLKYEIADFASVVFRSRSPRGERGLKSSSAAVVSPKCRPLSARVAVTESPTRYIQPSLTASLLRPALYCPKIRRKSDVCGGFFVFCGVLLPFFTK